MDINSIYQVYLNCELKTKEEVYSFISKIVSQDNPISKEEVIHQLNERDKIGSTLIAEHVMLPHIESDQLKKSQILFIRLVNPIITWDQSKDICLVIIILLKKNESVNIKKRISSFIRSFADEEYLNRLLKSHEEEEFSEEIIGY
ncbi:hypothetical protein CHH55_20705 [Niallia circulans]|uniref:PTS sugar transporter subunit IIA n=1 Tax=Niallia circulans TaxID=1397 RepID=UPI000BA75FD5|nr:PTS sugar transporter subunit IIA [Niallia circulans]PAD23665.1 hypothetical protein CHH62_21235 [Niallia circulans]PAD85959.1 hypothetical protein CHH55_20705 [Niallia circulans]